MADSTENQLRNITRGNLTGESAAHVLREAIPLVISLEHHAQAMRCLIKEAEDYLVYGQFGRPGNEIFR